MMKQLVKSALQHTAAGLGPHRWRGGGQLVILMYHRVLPPEDPRYVDEQPGMIVHPDTFAMHLRVARQHFELVDLGAWLDAAQSAQTLPERALAITFDDGWRDNLEYALPALEDADASATIFLVSDRVGDSGNYWPEQLAAAIRVAQDAGDDIWTHDAFAWLATLDAGVTRATDRDRIDAAIVAAKHACDDATLRERSSAMLRALGDPLESLPRALLDWDEVRLMQAGGRIRFGSHTVDHTRLTADLDPKQLAVQVEQSQRVLADGLGTGIDLFCYPNGDHCPAAVDAVAARYRAAVTTQGGWNTATTPRHRLHRIGVHEGNSGTPTALRARLSGWL